MERLFFWTLLLSFPSLQAQETDMFIEQISGKTIVRENFESSGKLIARQVFTAETMQRIGNDILVKINTKLYDENKRLESTYTTTYRCSPGESSVLLSVFAVNPSSKKVSVAVKSGDFKKLYALKPKDMVRNLSLTMYVETGLLNFLGSKNTVNIINRSLSKESGGWKISERIHIKAYLLGIRIKSLDYAVSERLSERGLLENQQFTQSNGDYFTITYQ
jgi:hypothetical protein